MPTTSDRKCSLWQDSKMSQLTDEMGQQRTSPLQRRLNGTCRTSLRARWASRKGKTRQLSSFICAITIVIAVVNLPLFASSIESDNLSNLMREKADASAQPQQSTATTTTTSTTFNSSSTAASVTTVSTPALAVDDAPSQPAVLRRDLGAKSQQQQQTATINAGHSRRSINGVCRLNDGESVAIMEIEESRGSDTSQTTHPIELPISGSLDEIELKIESQTHKYFQIQDKSLRLTRPLDRDATLKENSTQTLQQPITSIYLQISCVDKRQPLAKKTIIPVLVKVLDLNDNAPKFSQPIYSVQVNELAPIGTVILDQLAFAIDLDSASNGQIEYSLLGSQTIALTPPPAGKPISSKHNIAASNQRLVQRAEPVATTQNQPEVATSTTTPGLSHAVNGSIPSVAGELQTKSKSSQTGEGYPQATTRTISTSSTAQPSSDDGDELVTNPSSPTPVGDHLGTTPEEEEDDTDTSPVGAAATGGVEATQNGPPKKIDEPTINLNSEPILNGPMEDSEEEESDEALLASINATSNNSTDSEKEPPPVGDQSDLASSASRAFLPRWGSLKPVRLSVPVQRRHKRTRRQSSMGPLDIGQTEATTTSASAPASGRRKQLQLTTTAFMSSSSTRVPIAETTGPILSHPPWTNLMVIPNEDFQSLEALSGAGMMPSKSKQELLFDPEDNSFRSNDFFELELSPQTQKPIIRLKRQLDYETKRLHQLTLVATDRAQNKNERLSSQVRIVIRVLDGDDQPPAFILDQGGCATNLVTSATSPLPPTEASDTNKQPDVKNHTSGPLLDLLQQEAMENQLRLTSASRLFPRSTAQSGAQTGSNSRLRSFKVSDENFDFGDTLGLDDLPLDHEAVANDDEQRPAVSSHASVRSRRMTTPRSGSESQTPPNIRSLDYLCLAAKPSTRDGNQQLAEYFATVISGDTDYLLRVAPQSIKARDRDELNAAIRYSFVNGTPANYSFYFHINPLDATIKQVAPIERAHIKEFTLFIRAQEQSYNKLSSVAKLTIDVLPTDKSPPVLVPNSYSGFVNENSPVGTRVLASSANGFPALQNSTTSGDNGQANSYLRIAVVDADKTLSNSQQAFQAASSSAGDLQKSSSKQVKFEFETTSEAFKIDRDGFVYVNKFPLDRDLPGLAVHMFQVTARQVGLVSSKSISSPISLNITLGDLNDNPPQLLNATLGPVQMTANSRGGAQHLMRVEALDRDSPENSQMHFSIQHVSNMGATRFRIDEDSGRIDALGKFHAGEQFSLTVQVADELGRSSQGIVDVQVVPGANTGGPQFLTEANNHHHLDHNARARSSDADPSDGFAGLSASLARAAYYSVEVSEGVAVNSAIMQVRAIDPENDPISYSIIDGNINNDFSINSKTGALLVANKLDREEISAYKLIVQARDSGGLATSRPIHVLVTDLNDQNPIFSQEQYVFTVEEGLPSTLGGEGHLLGRVAAHDSDEGDNGRVTYSLILLDQGAAGSLGAPYAATSSRVPSGNVDNQQHASDRLFSIDATTGEIKLMKPLDYEQARSHTLLVVAHDNGENPRSSSAMVQVRVLDRQDEMPYFEPFHLEVRLDENQPNQQVGLVRARDPDSVAEVTYILLAGDSSLFQVDPQTGLVKTSGAGLDYEQTRFHSLLIGTNESLAKMDLADATQRLSDAIAAKQTSAASSHTLDRSPVMRVDVLVNDLNDNAPQFESGDLLMPVRVQDSATLGSPLPVHIRAHDMDGSSPNNQIRYELVSQADGGISTSSANSPQSTTSDRCAQLFLVDPSSGQLSIKADLRRDSQSECQLVIRARDLPHEGQQSLSSQVSLTVYIDHLIEISSSSQLSFADSSYTVELAENAPSNTLVRLLTIINKPKVPFPMSCEIVSGNEQSHFYVTENEHRDCELRTRDQLLDYEQRQRYTLMVKLNTVGGSSTRSNLAQINVNILDKNDNKPTFASQPARYNQLTQNKYLAAIAHDSPSETQLIQLRASDLDSSQANGLISYELLNGQELEGRFKVDPVDGILRTSRPIEDIPATRLPIRLRVLARDNPEQASESLDAVAEVVVNLIDDQHRIALVLKDTPASRVLDNKEELLGILQERTGLISGLERVESLKIQRNSSVIEADISGSDVWFYLIEPGSLRIVPSDDPRLKTSLFESRAQNSLIDVINQNLGFGKARIRLPYSLINALNANAQAGSSTLLFGAIRADANNRLASVLILVSLFIAIISAIVVIYQCGTVAGFSESASNHPHPAQLHSTQLHKHFAKEKFLFPPPPPLASQYQFASSTLGGDITQTPFGSLGRVHSDGPHQDKYGLTRSSFGPASALSNSNNTTPFASLNNGTTKEHQNTTGNNNDSNSQLKTKEYETQMLKMSVLFDDSQSFDGQNQIS